MSDEHVHPPNSQGLCLIFVPICTFPSGETSELLTYCSNSSPSHALSLYCRSNKVSPTLCPQVTWSAHFECVICSVRTLLFDKFAQVVYACCQIDRFAFWIDSLALLQIVCPYLTFFNHSFLHREFRGGVCVCLWASWPSTASPHTPVWECWSAMGRLGCKLGWNQCPGHFQIHKIKINSSDHPQKLQAGRRDWMYFIGFVLECVAFRLPGQ